MPNLDHPDLKDDREEFEKRLAELGPETVRTMMATASFPNGHNVVIHEWLAAQQHKDES